MQNGNIKVLEPSDDYKRIHKSIIRNVSIDCLTLGIYTKIVVLGQEWQLNIKGLSSVFGLSESKIRKSIGILEKEGYIKREANYHDGKLDGWVYNVYPEPIESSKRSNAGYKNEVQEEFQCCAESSVTENQTTLESDNTGNGEDYNNRLNKNINLINNKTNNNNNIYIAKSEEDWAEEMYKLYPTKCPVRGVSLGKTYKNKKQLLSLLKRYSREEIESVIRLEVKNKYGKYRMKDFSTFLNNFPDPSAICENTDNVCPDLFSQQENKDKEEVLLKSFYDVLGTDEAVIYGIDPNVWYTMDEKAKNYHRRQKEKKAKLLKWIKEHDNG